MPEETVWDALIVGGGPAGLSAAIFTSKAGKKTLVIDWGRTTLHSAYLKNYFGYPESILGDDLLEKGQRQARQFGAKIISDKVEGLRRDGDLFEVVTEENVFKGRNLILASGPLVDYAKTLGVEVVDAIKPKQVIKVDRYNRTNVSGVYAAGHGAGLPSQAIVAAGDGANAAITLLSDLEGELYVDHDKPPKEK
ncbi:MAG: FAD-dependent oxidoreductase [Candidatus Bipolaricaulia bacterium]